MKKVLLISFFAFLCIFSFPQELQHEAIAVNIEVPVRVFTKGKFVEALSIDDFEVYEDGLLQRIEALYLVKKTVIEREETELDKKMGRRIYLPEVSRTFVLVFEMMDYFPQVEETLTYFFENVFLPDDFLYVVTPQKTYSFKKEFLDRTPTEVIVDQLKEKLSKDIRLASRELKSLFMELQELSEQLRSDVSGQIMGAIRDILRRIRDYRYFDEKKLMDFKEQLKIIEGQKYIFLFYQKNVVPIPGKIGILDDFDDLVRPVISFNVDKVKKDFSDSSITINFIFVTKTDLYHIDGYRMNPAEQSSDPSTVGVHLIDQSAEIFGAFHEMAEATGGITDSSANVAASFERAAIASENYYLLYYTPKDYKSDGKFKSIKVKVKGKNYTIIHRAGYIAD